MSFPIISSTSNPIDLDDFKNLVKNFLENNESSFSTNLDLLIRVAEDFIWGSIGGFRTRFKTDGTENLVASQGYFDAKAAVITGSVGPPVVPDKPTGNIKDVLSIDVSSEYVTAGINWSPLQLRDYDFVTQAYPSSAETGLPRYYSADPLESITDPDENQNTIRIAISPAPTEDYFIRYSYTKFPLSLVDVTAGEGTWISRNYISALLYGVLYHGYLYEKGDMQLLDQYSGLFKESIMLAGKDVQEQDTSQYEKGTGPGDGGNEIT